MNSLRTRITALLLVAIVTVVGLATFAASRALQPPLPEATMEPVARQIGLLARLATGDPELAREAGVTLQDRPAEGPVEDKLTQMMTRAMHDTGSSYQVQVSRPEDMPAPMISVFLGGTGWLVTEMPDPAPPGDGWVILAIWIVMIIAGATIVSLYAAHRLISPLELLESAASRIGADGTLQTLPEDGPAEIRATARALNRLSARLRAAMESRMRLVAAAGHDLRTPMTRMRLRAEFIADDEEREKWLADLEELDRIADSAILLVREEANQDRREALRLDRLLREVGTELAELGHPVQLGDIAEAKVNAGPLALKRALRNLILNAATHGGGAEIALARRGNEAVITIRDDGPGIPEELIGRVFEPFFRVDPGRRKTLPGAGLGVAIAREIIERFGGRIDIKNLQPFGLLQTIALPVIEPAPKEA